MEFIYLGMQHNNRPSLIKLKNNEVIHGHVIPKGFETDGASIPSNKYILPILIGLLSLVSFFIQSFFLHWLILSLCLICAIVMLCDSKNELLKSAIVHDYLIQQSMKLMQVSDYFERRAIRINCDAEFYAVMTKEGIHPVKKRLVYYAVVLHGLCYPTGL